MSDNDFAREIEHAAQLRVLLDEAVANVRRHPYAPAGLARALAHAELSDLIDEDVGDRIDPRTGEIDPKRYNIFRSVSLKGSLVTIKSLEPFLGDWIPTAFERLPSLPIDGEIGNIVASIEPLDEPDGGSSTPARRNQGTLHTVGGISYAGMWFRSHTEVRVAKALEDANVLFFALPTARRRHVSKEPDFVIVHKGRIGVMEVDGPHHTSMTRADEDSRAAWLRMSGVHLIRHFPVEQIDADVAGVVAEFLADLRGPRY